MQNVLQGRWRPLPKLGELLPWTRNLRRHDRFTLQSRVAEAAHGPHSPLHQLVVDEDTLYVRVEHPQAQGPAPVRRRGGVFVPCLSRRCSQ